MQNVTFPIELSIPEAELILNGLNFLPKRDADPVFAKIQQAAIQKIQQVQTQGAANQQVQADINQCEANSDSMRNE